MQPVDMAASNPASWGFESPAPHQRRRGVTDARLPVEKQVAGSTPVADANLFHQTFTFAATALRVATGYNKGESRKGEQTCTPS